MAEPAEVAPTGLPIPYRTIEMDGDHYVETLHDLTDLSGVPRDIYEQYEPTFMRLPVEEQHALLLEGIRRGYVKLISRTEGEAWGTLPVPPSPLFELLTPYPPNFGGSPALDRSERTRPDGTRVVTLTGRLTCLAARLWGSTVCGGDEGRQAAVVRVYELRPDGIPVRFTETFGGTPTKVVTLEDLALS
jgi:hypothetical protein